VNRLIYLILITIVSLPLWCEAQVNHWEMVVSDNDSWNYIIPDATTSSTWYDSSFNASSWSVGVGGFGYGDNDDNTIIPNNSSSIYFRKNFIIQDIQSIKKLMLAIDYDDGFIAYLNGNLLVSRNLPPGGQPQWNTLATASHEAVLYSGGQPDKFYFSEIEFSTLLVQGANTLSIAIFNNTVNSNDLTGRCFLLAGIADTSQTYFNPPVWFTPPVDLYASNLPIVVVNTNFNSIPDEPKIDATMGIIYQHNGDTNYLADPFNEFYGQIRIERRGSSSNTFPAKSYGLETNGPNELNYNASIFDWPADNDWILYAPYTDKAMIRNVLTYQWGRDMGNYAPRTKLCELILNNEYMGVYVFMERIKSNPGRVPIDKLTYEDTMDNHLTGGYILKVDKTTAGGVIAWPSPYPPASPGAGTIGIQLHDPEIDTIHPLQLAYIQSYFTAFENALAGVDYTDPVLGYAPFINTTSFIDFFLANELTKNVDGYRISSFLYKERYSEGGELVAGPLWDFNIALGNANYCQANSTTGWAKNFNSICGGGQLIPFWWNRLLSDSTFANLTHCRWLELRQGPLSDTIIMSTIDSFALMLNGPSQRHYIKWPILGTYVWPNNFIGLTYDEEINYLKTWISNRLTWLDANMVGTCSNLSSPISTMDQLKVFPNPSDHKFYIEGITHPCLARIYSQSGQLILCIPLNSFTNEISSEDLEHGMYILQIDGKTQHYKLIISHS
jgi:hypothetical protein